MVRGLKMAGLAVALCVVASLVPLAHGQGGASERMSRGEISKRRDELRAAGLKTSEINQLLSISKADKAVFEACVKLYQSNVPMGPLRDSIYACKGEPVLLDEYWEFVQKHHCNAQEVTRVFRTFPPNKIMRWWYFYYRTGKYGWEEQMKAYLAKQPKDRGPSEPPPKLTGGYSEREVLAVFRAARFDVNYVQEYFEARDKGVSPKEAWAPLAEKIKAEIEKEREEQRKKAEEAKSKREAEIQARKDAIAAMSNKAAEGKEKEEKPTMLTGADLARLLSGEPDEDEQKAEEPDDQDDTEEEVEEESEGEQEQEENQDEGQETEDKGADEQD